MTVGASGEEGGAAAPAEQGTPWWRPLLHATPRRAWMNDPNGLIRDGGTWHLFFQHHADGVVWGPMSWGHATSPDLVRWTEQPVAIAATPTEHVFSGCAVRDGDRLVAVYTAVDPETQRQTQALATSGDDGATWQRFAGNPVLDLGSTQWRDPKVFRDEASDPKRPWVMAVVLAEDLVVQVWRSADLVVWDLTGEVGPFERPAGARSGPFHWEVPDLVRLPVEGGPGRREWVLLLSVNPGGPAGGSGQAYATGSFDGVTFVPDPLPGNAFGPFSWADHGPDFYAASTFAGLRDDEPPVWVGWMSNWLYADRTPTAPWRGAATIARELSLRDVDGRLVLVQRPVVPAGASAAEVLPAGAEPVIAEPVIAEPADAVRDFGVQRHELVVPPGGAAGVDVHVRPGGVATRVEVRDEPDGPVLVVDRRASGEVDFHDAFPVVARAPLPGVRRGPDGSVRTTLEIVLDACSVEVFAAEGAACVTMLVFPPPQ